MSTAEMNEKQQGAARSILNSLAAGVAAMTVFGVMASYVVNGGLGTPAAEASTPADAAFGDAPVVRPLDVDAVQAELEAVQAEMRATQAATAAAMTRLERLSGN